MVRKKIKASERIGRRNWIKGAFVVCVLRPDFMMTSDSIPKHRLANERGRESVWVCVSEKEREGRSMQTDEDILFRPQQIARRIHSPTPLFQSQYTMSISIAYNLSFILLQKRSIQPIRMNQHKGLT